MFRPHPTRGGSCTVCGGWGSCPECRGFSAVYVLYGNPYVQVRQEQKQDEATGLWRTLTDEEYAEANDPSKRPDCATCHRTGRCPACGTTGRSMEANW